jgi:hypothetical protein
MAVRWCITVRFQYNCCGIWYIDKNQWKHIISAIFYAIWHWNISPDINDTNDEYMYLLTLDLNYVNIEWTRPMNNLIDAKNL